MRIYVLIILLFISSCSSNRKCKKIPWWERQPNKYFKQEQKQDSKKYKSHKKSVYKKNKCK